MSRYTGQDIIALAQGVGATPELARIMGAAAMAEGGGDSEAVGDNGHSIGAYQINDIHGLTGDQRRDLDFATRWMYAHEFGPAYSEGLDRGYDGEQLARWGCMRAERPFGWNGPNDPGLDSPAADNYAAHWRALEAPMPITRTYDPSMPRVAQTDDWSCSVASLCWALQSIGINVRYSDLEQTEIDAGLVSTALGLLVGSGGPLADWVAATYDVTTGHDPDVSWEWLQEHAGTMPIMLGGHSWGVAGHWVAVRGVDGDGDLLLANPADGYAGIFETLTEAQFNQVGPCSAVWIEVEEAEDVGKIDELTNLLGNIQGDWSDAVESAINDAKREPNKAKRNADLDAALAALQTIRNGG